MFTGIIETFGTVRGTKAGGLFQIEAPGILKSLKVGGSLAVNGACLTVVKKRSKSVFFDVVQETKKRTTLGGLRPGDRVNLERPLRANGRIEGHFVLGHVDGVGVVRQTLTKPGQKSFLIVFPKELKRYFFEKGSVAVDGISLTLGKVLKDAFWVHGIPHTLSTTTLGTAKVKTNVNLEADLLAKLAVKLV